MEEDGRPLLESVGLDEVQDQDQDELEDQDQDEDGDGADEHEENANSGSGSSAAQPGTPNSPLLVESDKDKQPADGENDKEVSSGAAVNSDMILEALESLDHKNLRGTSLEQILDFLLRTYPVSRDRSVLRAELSGCLQSAVEQGLVRLNQNGSYRLASFHEEATEREHGHDAGPSRPGSSKDKDKDGQGRQRGRRGAEQKAPKPAAKPRRGRTPASEDSEDSDWRPPSSTPSPSRARGGKRGRRRASGKATRKSPRLHSSPGSASSPSPGRAATPRAPRPAPRAATPAPTAPAKPQRAPGRASTPAPRRTPKAAVRKRKAAASRARSSSRGSSRGSSRASSSRRQPAAKRRRRM